MVRVAKAPLGLRQRASRAFALLFVIATGSPIPAFAIDLADILRSGAGMQSAREAQRAMQQRRDTDAALRQRSDADACSRLKSWVSSVPAAAGSRRSEDWMPLLEDERFSRAFGKPYDQLGSADFQQLQQAQLACQRSGTLTPGEMQTVQSLLNASMQPQLSRQLAAARAQRGELQSLLAELDALPATEQAAQRLDAIAARLATQLRSAAADDSRAAQARLDAARTRVALPVHTARIQRLIAEARGAEGIAALAAALDDLNRSGLGAQCDPLRKQVSDRINELAAPALRDERSAVAALPPGLPGLERGVPYFATFTSRYQKAIAVVPELGSFRDEFLAKRAATIAVVTSELSAEVQKAKSEAEVGALLSRYLLDLERQQAARAVTRLAAERVASLKQAGDNQRVFGAATAPTSGKVLADPTELRKYEAGAIVRAIYHADLSGLRDDPVFTRKYLIAQAGHLGENCDTFKVTEVRAYEASFQKEVVTAAQQNMGQMLRQSLNLVVQAQKNPASIVDAGAAQQRLEDAPDFAVSDVERLAKTYGGCDAAVIVRYTRNLRAYLERAR